MKKKKKAVLVVSFGTSYQRARKESLERIVKDVGEDCGLPVYQAYTSNVILRKLSLEHIRINTVEEAVERVLSDQVTHLYVVPTHMIPGMEYHKLKNKLMRQSHRFQSLRIAPTVLEQEGDCLKAASLLEELFSLEEETADGKRAYLFMGHGTESEANVRYEQMNLAFEQMGLCRVRIASVEAKPDLDDAITYFSHFPDLEEIVLHPFMVVAGEHALHDMAGEGASFAGRLREKGYLVKTVLTGLGEYAAFRKLYLNKLRRLLDGRFYVVGVGPGDPGLMTLQAANILKESDILGIPAENPMTCAAYLIAQRALPELEDKPMLCVRIPMTRRPELLRIAYEEAADSLLRELNDGNQVAFLNLGDPTVYGTGMELAGYLRARGIEVGVVSGVTSFGAAAAALGISLAKRKEAIHILPGGDWEDGWEGLPGTKVILKAGKRLPQIRKELIALEEAGKVRAYAVTNCGMENEAIYEDLRQMPEDAGYFTTILVKEGNVPRKDGNGTDP